MIHLYISAWKPFNYYQVYIRLHIKVNEAKVVNETFSDQFCNNHNNIQHSHHMKCGAFLLCKTTNLRTGDPFRAKTINRHANTCQSNKQTWNYIESTKDWWHYKTWIYTLTIFNKQSAFKNEVVNLFSWSKIAKLLHIYPY